MIKEEITKELGKASGDILGLALRVAVFVGGIYISFIYFGNLITDYVVDKGAAVHLFGLIMLITTLFFMPIIESKDKK